MNEIKSLRHLILFFILILAINHNPEAKETIATIEYKQLTVDDDIGNAKLHLQSIARLTNISINNIKISELSGLAWDNDDEMLYAISDNGNLLHLNPVFENEILKAIIFENGYPLLDENNKQLRWKKADSEGITLLNNNNHIKGDTEVIICFERFPRIIKYDVYGNYLVTLKIPQNLTIKNNFKSENKMFESITYHPGYGLIAGIEQPLNTNPGPGLDIYSLDNKSWHFIPDDEARGSLVGMTATPGGNLLLLERAYYEIWQKFYNTIHEVSLDSRFGEGYEVTRFRLSDEIFNENFEGITHYKDNYYFMISDDNNHPFKRTSLILFKIIH